MLSLLLPNNPPPLLDADVFDRGVTERTVRPVAAVTVDGVPEANAKPTFRSGLCSDVKEVSRQNLRAELVGVMLTDRETAGGKRQAAAVEELQTNAAASVADVLAGWLVLLCTCV